ncbi:uncharacterized protein LOC143519126 [Brachyhypopomus gauderio]|uniref:uncharacterized protein LOC143519126 n=1 Tax=Brachyhypopomus gauderio TaxID=698409 RepID=UPI0040422146
MNVLQTVMSGGRETKIGSVGPYPLYVGSFQSLIESNNEVSDEKKVGQALMESGNVHAAMAKTEDCRKTLDAVKNALEANWETFDLSTHGLGPAVIKGTFALIDACLKEKMRALKSIDYTDE